MYECQYYDKVEGKWVTYLLTDSKEYAQRRLLDTIACHEDAKKRMVENAV